MIWRCIYYRQMEVYTGDIHPQDQSQVDVPTQEP